MSQVRVLSPRQKNSVMDNVYKKTTKYDVDFPAYCFFFLNRILKNLKTVELDDTTTVELEISTSEHPYCYDAFELIVRTLERKGIWSRIPGFKREKIEGQSDILHYKFTIKKLKVYDNLPF